MSCFLSVLPERSVGPRSSHTQCHVIYVGHVVSSVGCVGPKWVVSSICASVLFSSGTCDLFWEVILAQGFFILTSWLVDIRSVGIGRFRSGLCEPRSSVPARPTTRYVRARGIHLLPYAGHGGRPRQGGAARRRSPWRHPDPSPRRDRSVAARLQKGHDTLDFFLRLSIVVLRLSIAAS